MNKSVKSAVFDTNLQGQLIQAVFFTIYPKISFNTLAKRIPPF